MPFLKGKSILESRCRNLENLANKNGLRHAVFTPLYDRYIGEWKNNAKHGVGSYLTRSAHLYEGEFDEGYRHGFGVLAVRNDINCFVLEGRGQWKRGRMCGPLNRHYPDGSYYEGNWSTGKRHGQGQQWNADGSYYIGSWHKDQRHGEGMFVRHDGSRYEGHWTNDKKHGKGRFYHMANGQMQEGIWVDDCCVYSCMVGIPFRQTALEPTEYPIQANELKHPDELCKIREEHSLAGKLDSCTSMNALRIMPL